MSHHPQLPLATSRLSDKNAVRACESCRTRKMRCLQDVSLSLVKCQRCAKSNRECVFSEPTKTRRRKRTDTRVAELEQEVKAMSTALRQGNIFSVQRDAEDDVEYMDINGDDKEVGKSNEPLKDGADGKIPAIREPFMTVNGEIAQLQRGGSVVAGYRDTNDIRNPSPSQVPRARSNASNNSPLTTDIHTSHVNNEKGEPMKSVQPSDVIDRGLLSIHEASQLYTRYSHELVQYFPTVILPEGYDAADIRRKNPTLFLAVIAAASGSSDADLNVSLNKEIMQIYADQIVIKGEKSLELIQSILITIAWYCPPDNFEELKFYQYIHMAATMALDLGIGKKTRGPIIHSHTLAAGFIESPGSESLREERCRDSFTNSPPIDSGLLDSRRTILSCYLNCSSVSVSLHRPNMLRFSNYMSECIEFLENSPNAALNDHRLIAWIQLQRIMEECSTSFAFDDPSAIISLEEPRIQLMLKGFEKKLNGWRESLRPGIMNETLLMSFHVNKIYLHEMALHPDHDTEDFRPPFLVKTTTNAKDNTSVSPAYLDSIMICLSSAHGLLTAFLKTSVETLRVVPVVTYVRMVYGAVVLTKLHFSAISPTSEISKVLDHDSLQVGQYLNKLVIHLMAVVGEENNRMASKFLMILIKLKAWYGKHRMQVHSTVNPDEHLEPCMHIRPHHTETEIEIASSPPRGSPKRKKIVHESEKMEFRDLEPPLKDINCLPQAKNDNSNKSDVEIFANSEVDLAEIHHFHQMGTNDPPALETEYTLPHDGFHFGNSIDFGSDNLVLFNGPNSSSEDLDSWMLYARMLDDSNS